MRIIAGKFKGRTLFEVSGDQTRPTMDRVKQSLFDVLSQKVAGAVCLDLFAGSGALGLEALSRGASECVFVDKDKESVKVVKANLEKLKIEAQVLQLDYIDALKTLKNQGKTFDIVFLDPPYKTDFGILAIKFLKENDLLNQNGIVVFETNQNFDDALQNARKLDYKNKFVYILN